MWVLIVMTFGFVTTDKVVFQEFASREKCEAAKAFVQKADANWKDRNIKRGTELYEARNMSPQMDCVPK